MAVTDAEFNALKRRVSDLEDIHAGQRLANIRQDVDAQGNAILLLKSDANNAHAAFLDLRELVDELVMRVGALESRVAVLEAANPTVAAAP